MNDPLVSIFMPVYNAGQYLRQSLESILSQTYCNLEILIVDDGSTDGCMDSISDISDSRVVVSRQSNTGKSVVMNSLLGVAKGQFYAIQDADDVSHPRRIEKQVECMLRHPHVAAVFSGNDIVVGDKAMAPCFSAKSISQCNEDIEHFRMPAHDPTGMFRMSMVKTMWYEPSLRVAQAMDYILQVGELFPMMVMGECLYSYRIHRSSNTRRDSDLRQQMVNKVVIRARRRRGLSVQIPVVARTEKSGKHVSRQRETGVVPHFIESVTDLRKSRKYVQALKTTAACISLHPLDIYYYKPFPFFLAPDRLIRFYRGLKSH